MSIKPIDITNKSFNSKFKGYDRDEVDDFLDQVALEVEKLTQENKEYEKEVRQANEKLSYFSELKDSLNQSIIVAQDTADKLKENASKESDLAIQQAQAQSEDILAHANKMSDELISGATNKANEILMEASERARQLAVETDELKKKTRVFHRNLSVLIESQLQLVQNEEWDEILKPFGAYVDSHHAAFKEVLEAVESANTAPVTETKGIAIEVQPTFSTESQQKELTPEEQYRENIRLAKEKAKKEQHQTDRPERASRDRV